ncbi:MAG: sensor histidine kinase [Chloroflexi bacterium]|nr:sensor histidine kinase [Chloroflexota bacterium]
MSASASNAATVAASRREPIARTARRERLFTLIRFGALALLGVLGTLMPDQPGDVLASLWTIVALGALLNSAFWLFLRVQAASARWIPSLASAIDMVGLVTFISLTGGPRSSLWLFAFVVIAAVALRHGTLGGVVAAVFFSLASISLSLFAGLRPLDALYGAAVTGLAYAGVALTVGWLIREERAAVRSEHEQTQLDLQRGQADVKTFVQMADTLSRNTNYQETLQQMLELSIRGLRSRGRHDDPAAGLILLFATGPVETLYVAVASDLPPEDAQARLSPISGAVKTALDDVEAQFVTDARKDPLLCQFRMTATAPAAVVMPLRAGLALYGAAVFFGRPEMFDVFGLRAELIDVYTGQAAVAVQNAQLYEQVRQERDRFIDSEEKTRHELARDLHDGPVNQVASLTMGIDFARRLMDRDLERAKEELDGMHRLAAKIARDMRLTMYRLRPLALEQAGLTQALEQYLARLRAERAEPEFVLSVDKSATFEARLPANAAMMVFDIMTEAVNNAVKHANAGQVQVELREAGGYLVASTRDDGRGFDVAKVTAGYADRGSLGLLNIRERAELAHGDAVIESTPGQGTIITVRVPLDPAA